MIPLKSGLIFSSTREKSRNYSVQNSRKLSHGFSAELSKLYKWGQKLNKKTYFLNGKKIALDFSLSQELLNVNFRKIVIKKPVTIIGKP